MLSGYPQTVRATSFDGALLGPFSSFYDGRGATEVGVGQRGAASTAMTEMRSPSEGYICFQST